MRVLITFENPFAANSYGGGNQATRGLAKALAALGHAVHVVCAGVDELEVSRQDAGVTYHFTGTYNPRTTTITTSRLAIALARRLRPRIVVCMTSEAVFVAPAARALGARVLVYLGTPRLAPFGHLRRDSLRDLRRGVGWFLQFLGSHAATRVVTVSHSLAAEAREQWRIRAGRVAVAGLGMDDAILAAPVMPAPEIPTTGPRLVSVGRIVHEQKPLDVMAEGLASVRRDWTSWTIVGSGIDEPRLRARVSELGIASRVVFLGSQLPARVREELDRSHIVLLPSRYEGYFTTVYEAVARGRVVVTTAVNDVARSFGGVDSVLIADRADVGQYRLLIEQAIEGYPRLADVALAAAMPVRATETWEAAARRILTEAGLGDHG